MRYTTIGLVFFLMIVPGIAQAEEMSDAEKAQASITIIEPVLDLCRSRLVRRLNGMQSIKDNPKVGVDGGTIYALEKTIGRLRKCVDELERDLANLRLHLPGGNISTGQSASNQRQPPQAPQQPRKRIDPTSAVVMSHIGVNDNDVWEAYNEMAVKYNKIWGL